MWGWQRWAHLPSACGGPAVDAASQTIELKAQFNEKYESLIPGMSGIVKF